MIYSEKHSFEFEFKDPCLCSAWVATAIVGSAVVGGIANTYAANKAADATTKAGERAIAFQQDQFNKTREDLAPYRAMGVDAGGKLAGQLDYLTSPTTLPTFDTTLPVAPKPLTQAELEATPGYQFMRTQGLKTAQNSAAARGLGKSGAAMKGALSFQAGLDDSTYNTRFGQRQQEFGNELSLFQGRQALNQLQQQNFANTTLNKSTAYDRLKGLIDTGAGAAGMTGTLGEKAAYNSGNAAVGIGSGQAAADNKIGTSIANTAGGLGEYAKYKGIYGTPSGASGFSGNGVTAFNTSGSGGAIY